MASFPSANSFIFHDFRFAPVRGPVLACRTARSRTDNHEVLVRLLPLNVRRASRRREVRQGMDGGTRPPEEPDAESLHLERGLTELNTIRECTRGVPSPSRFQLNSSPKPLFESPQVAIVSARLVP